jgi:signal transduction histidine kinase
MRAAYLVSVEGERLVVRRFVATEHRFEPASLPTELESLRRWYAAQEHAFQGSRPANADLPFPILESVPALVIPSFLPPQNMSGAGARSPFERRLWPPPAAVIVLDSQVIAAEMLPALAERYFHGHDGLEYNLRVVRQDDRSAEIWRAAEASSAWQRTETAIGMFDVVLEPRWGRGRGPGLPGPGPRVRDGDSGRWRLEVAFQRGPIDELVARVRRMNLAVSFGILLLLGATFMLAMISMRRAQHLAERQMEFVAAVSHELRTPVAVIHSASENLADGVVRDLERVRTYGTTIRDESRRLADMVEDVLRFAGASTRGRSLESERAPLAAIVEDALAALQSSIVAGGFVVDTTLPPDGPIVRGDLAMLRHAVQNLIENAIKYDTGQRRIAVAVAATGEGEAEVSVADRGAGIARGELTRVFEPFYRGRRAREQQVRGFGLGLALVKRAAQEHGGTVRVTSTEGKGSTFTLRLPTVAAVPPLQDGRA